MSFPVGNKGDCIKELRLTMRITQDMPSTVKSNRKRGNTTMYRFRKIKRASDKDEDNFDDDFNKLSNALRIGCEKSQKSAISQVHQGVHQGVQSYNLPPPSPKQLHSNAVLEKTLNDGAAKSHTVSHKGSSTAAEMSSIEMEYTAEYEQSFKPVLDQYEAFFSKEVTKYQNKRLDEHIIEEGYTLQDSLPRQTPLTRSTLQDLAAKLKRTLVQGRTFEVQGELIYHPDVDNQLENLYKEYRKEYNKVSSAYKSLYDKMLNRWCNQFEASKDQIVSHLFALERVYAQRHDSAIVPLAEGVVKQFMEHAPIKAILDKIDQEFATLNENNGTHFKWLCIRPDFTSQVNAKWL